MTVSFTSVYPSPNHSVLTLLYTTVINEGNGRGKVLFLNININTKITSYIKVTSKH